MFKAWVVMLRNGQLSHQCTQWWAGTIHVHVVCGCSLLHASCRHRVSERWRRRGVVALLIQDGPHPFTNKSWDLFMWIYKYGVIIYTHIYNLIYKSFIAIIESLNQHITFFLTNLQESDPKRRKLHGLHPVSSYFLLKAASFFGQEGNAHIICNSGYHTPNKENNDLDFSTRWLVISQDLQLCRRGSEGVCPLEPSLATRVAGC